jgi:AraC-like DNA-binding protein
MATADSSQWVRYWRPADVPAEIMQARFTSHVYHRHSHETYSFGVTETGAQAFACRHATHVSTAGLVMAFNPDDPHDGHAGDRAGFTYRMLHISPEFFTELLADVRSSSSSRPLFRAPVIDDPSLASSLIRLHAALTGAAPALPRYETLAETTRLLVRHASDSRIADSGPRSHSASIHVATRVRDLIHDMSDPSAEELANAAGCSRYSAYRAFLSVYGLTPSEYQRQLRLRTARRLLADGVPPAHAAAETGFADQAHLSRWFRRCYGVTPAAYQAAHERPSPVWNVVTARRQ